MKILMLFARVWIVFLFFVALFGGSITAVACFLYIYQEYGPWFGSGCLVVIYLTFLVAAIIMERRIKREKDAKDQETIDKFTVDRDPASHGDTGFGLFQFINRTTPVPWSGDYQTDEPVSGYISDTDLDAYRRAERKRLLAEQRSRGIRRDDGTEEVKEHDG